MKITILCADDDSNYFKLNDSDLDIWTRDRDAWNYNGTNPVICHAPCQQWSRLRHFARFDASERMIAYHCWELMIRNGGIFEHPEGSLFFKAIKAERTKILSVDQHWWNFPSRKRTYLYFNQCTHLQFPVNFNAIEYQLSTNKARKSGIRQSKPEMKKGERSKMPVAFCQWLVDCVRETYKPGHSNVTVFEEPKTAPS